MPQEDKPKGQPNPASDREARRAAALRENLKRRKQKPPEPAADNDLPDKDASAAGLAPCLARPQGSIESANQ
ncbi:MAG: hypothetical protein JNJ73_20755 [Hyphomonadaceae bacterium]|nr:hypothetical protein [Hyphomonadaceae bacterium]